MKRIHVLCSTFLLAACIHVEDIGTYWDQGIIDPALSGKWVQDKETKRMEITLLVKDNLYQMDSLDSEERQKKDYTPLLARTLKVGGYTFFMTSSPLLQSKSFPKESDIYRYKMEKDTFTLYSLRASGLGDFLVQNHLQPKNIEMQNDDIRIKRFDEEVFKTLSAIPDTDHYWKTEDQYHRVR